MGSERDVGGVHGSHDEGEGVRLQEESTPNTETTHCMFVHGAPHHVHAVTRAIGSTLTHVVQQDGKRGEMRHPY